MIVVFRVDASITIGIGHLMRCLALGGELAKKGWCCFFACETDNFQIVTELVGEKHSIVRLPIDARHHASTLFQQLPKGVDLLVVDSYKLDASFGKSCRGWADLILVIDDLADRQYEADILVDQTFGRSEYDYSTLIGNSCRVLTGSRFALLRPEFARMRQSSLNRRDANCQNIGRILVSLGSNDPDNITTTVLDGIIATEKAVEIDVVLGSQAPHYNLVSSRVANLSGARMYSEFKDMPGLMASADISIGAGGTTSWERCCMGLPSITMTLARNQFLINQNLHNLGAVAHLGSIGEFGKEDISTSLTELISSPSAVRSMSMLARMVCDGQGIERVINQL